MMKSQCVHAVQISLRTNTLLLTEQKKILSLSPSMWPVGFVHMPDRIGFHQIADGTRIRGTRGSHTRRSGYGALEDGAAAEIFPRITCFSIVLGLGRTGNGHG